MTDDGKTSPIRERPSARKVAAVRENGKLGGRSKGSVSADKITLRERCRENDEKHIARLERIAEFSKNDRDAISAINTLLDRGHGRAPSPTTVTARAARSPSR